MKSMIILMTPKNAAMNNVNKTMIKGLIIDCLPNDLSIIFNNATFQPNGYSYINGYDKSSKISINLIGIWDKDLFHVKNIVFSKNNKQIIKLRNKCN